ncbi:nudix (nucleoside diphosphate linked moiety X)-type motif 2 [Halocaridina rubra]|uniref:Bis(5'-nucleosyl)-tetraphosphatase [asymmetrical] n=1 Tax=Halocaridina rubra TaxID=373956 RepID=A0AAN8WY90_HALRR
MTRDLDNVKVTKIGFLIQVKRIMSELRAAGLIIFRRMASEIEYLLMQTSYGIHHWTPPKGHVDPGESDRETALRETQEEAGLKSEDFSLIEEFRKEVKYKVNGEPKTVIYWLAELRDPNSQVVLSEEHQDYRWLPLTEACTLAGFKDMIHILHECNDYLKKADCRL